MQSQAFVWRCPCCGIRQKQPVRAGGPVHTLLCRACGRISGHRDLAREDRTAWLAALGRVLPRPGHGEFWPARPGDRRYAIETN